MKMRLISATLALLLCLVFLPAGALAAGFEFDMSKPPQLTELEVIQEEGEAWLQIRIKTPGSVRNLMDELAFFEKDHYLSGVQLSASLEGGSWKEFDLSVTGTGDPWNGYWRTEVISSLTPSSWVQARVRYIGEDDGGKAVLSDWSDIISVNEKGSEPEIEEPPFDFNAHDWAKPELTEADGLGLISAGLRNADLTQPITRAEFAAVSVKVYEALSGLQAEPAAENPFTDTSDPEVLKALHVGITNGLSATEFAPDKLLNREQAATMLSRVYKKVAFEGWTLGTDGDFAEAFRTLFTMPEPFADDADISPWARDSVYFMASNGIIKGMEGGTFQPRAVTEEQQAAGHAQATREQAILIAVRLVKNLGA